MRPLGAAIVALLFATDLALAQNAPWREEELRYTAADGVELAALVLIPTSEGPHPAAVLIQGSGESDRTNIWARTVAETLAREGIVVLLPDKRGSGASGGNWLEASFEVLAHDALAGVEVMRARPDVHAVGLVGLSQGGFIAPLAATLGEVDWIVDVSGSAVPLAQQMRHEMANTARSAGLGTDGVEAVLEIQTKAENFVRLGEWDPYAAALSAAEGTPWAEIAAGFPDSQDSPAWPWVRLVADYDPLPYWERVEVPVFVAYGAEDEGDNVPVAASVKNLESALADHPDASVEIFPGTGHALWAADATQESPKLDEAFADRMTSWISERSASQSGH